MEAKGEVVVVLVDDGPGVEDGRLGNRSLSFQTSGMHGEGLLGLFGACQQNEWSVENSGAPPAQQVLVRQGSVSRLKLGLRERLLGLEEHGWSVGSAGLRGRRPGQEGREDMAWGLSGANADGLFVGLYLVLFSKFCLYDP